MILNKIKNFIRWGVFVFDYTTALLYAFFFHTSAKSKKVLLIPAADINGGFGEDIMVAGFLKEIDAPVTILATIDHPRRFLQEHDVVFCSIDGRLKYLQLVKYLKRHTDLYIIGADILDGMFDTCALRFNALRLAHRMNVQTHITGFSVRETSSSYFISSIQEVSKYTNVLARDTVSYSRLKKYCQDVVCTADIAFLCGCPSANECRNEVQEWVTTKRNGGRKIIAYCPNTIQASKMGLQNYLAIQKRLLSIFVENGCCILFLYHDLRKYALGINDKDLSEMIYSFFPKDGFFIADVTDGYSLKSYLQLADFTVTGRMHFGISGYTIGIPMFGISYYGKFEGLQEMFGINPETSLIDYNVEIIDDKNIKKTVINNTEHKQQVLDKLEYVIQLAKLNIQDSL